MQQIKTIITLDNAPPSEIADVLTSLLAFSKQGPTSAHIRLLGHYLDGNGVNHTFDVYTGALENAGSSEVRDTVSVIRRQTNLMGPISGSIEITTGKAKTEPATLAVGDVVTLKSGGSRMTITGVYEKPSEYGLKPGHVDVSYTGPNRREMFGGFGRDTVQHERYPIAALKKAE